jgi:hypothetical protein
LKIIDFLGIQADSPFELGKDGQDGSVADEGESHGRHCVYSLYVLLFGSSGYVPHGLGVRIPDSHSGGPGSIPGAGGLFHSFIIELLYEKYS